VSDGFFLVYRGWRSNPVFRGAYSKGEAWLWLLETACFKPTSFDIKGRTVTLQRGQLCASREQLSAAWSWSGSAVERFLTRLQTEQMIGRETGQGKSIITICNYAKYQDVGERAGQETGQGSGQKSDRNRTAKEQGNKLPLSNDNGGADFWSFAVAYLGEGRRSLIGKWRKDHSQAEVANAITQAQFANAVEPVAYIERTLRGAAESKPLVPL
jgi:hypothetical protein